MARNVPSARRATLPAQRVQLQRKFKDQYSLRIKADMGSKVKKKINQYFQRGKELTSSFSDFTNLVNRRSGANLPAHGANGNVKAPGSWGFVHDAPGPSPSLARQDRG
jgi:hypothetical protein